MSENEVTVGKPSIRKAMKFTLGDTYHNLGKLVLSNLLWTAAFGPSLVVSLRVRESPSPTLLLLLAGCFLVTSPVLAGMFTISLRIATKEHEIGMADFFGGMKKHWRKSLILTLISVIVPLAAGSSLVFYGQLAQTTAVAVILWIVNLWILIFFLLAQIYFFPLMVGQKMTLGQILKTSFSLALGNGVFTFVIVVFEVAVLWLCSVTGVIFVLGVGLIAVLQSNAFIQVAKRYIGEEVTREIPRTERQKRRLGDILRDTFFPWKYD